MYRAGPNYFPLSLIGLISLAKKRIASGNVVAANSDEARARANLKFKKSQQAATTRDKMLAEHAAEADRQRAKTAKLKALRLAKEAVDLAAAEAMPPKKKPAGKAPKKAGKAPKK